MAASTTAAVVVTLQQQQRFRDDLDEQAKRRAARKGRDNKNGVNGATDLRKPALPPGSTRCRRCGLATSTNSNNPPCSRCGEEMNPANNNRDNQGNIGVHMLQIAMRKLLGR